MRKMPLTQYRKIITKSDSTKIEQVIQSVRIGTYIDFLPEDNSGQAYIRAIGDDPEGQWKHGDYVWMLFTLFNSRQSDDVLNGRSGWIYMVKSQTMVFPDRDDFCYYKIGLTQRDPFERIQEITREHPKIEVGDRLIRIIPTHCEFAVFVTNVFLLEKHLHHRWRNWRLLDTEWFALCPFYVENIRGGFDTGGVYNEWQPSIIMCPYIEM